MNYKFQKLVFLVVVSMLLCCMVGCVNQRNNTNEVETGVFYSLKEAYAKKILTNEDLIKISDFYTEMQYDIKTQSESVGQLDKSTISQIKRSYLLNILKDTTIPDSYVNVYAYYGTYQGCIAIGVTDSYYCYDMVTIKEYQVGSVLFYNFSESEIRIFIRSSINRWD